MTLLEYLYSGSLVTKAKSKDLKKNKKRGDGGDAEDSTNQWQKVGSGFQS